MTVIVPQPASWYLDLAIGSNNLTTIPPQYVQTFTHTRTMLDAVGSFQVDLFYEGNSELEDLIAEQGFGANTENGNVFFRYGLSSGGSSEVYQGILTNYALDFQGGGTLLTISGTSLAVVSNSRAYTASYTGTSIHDIVKQIAAKQNWDVGIIEPCVPVLSSFDDITGNPTHKAFYQMNVQPLQFIKEELIPYSVSSVTGMGGYTVSLRDSGSSRPILDFCTPQITKPSVFQYLYYAGVESNIISWNPQIQDVINMLKGGGQLGISTMDSTTNNLISFVQSEATAKSMPIMGSRVFANKNAAISYMNASSMLETEMQAKAKSLWTKNANLSYVSTMEVPYSPVVNPNDNVDILIMNSAGQPHYTSGVYLVSQVIDTLDDTGAVSTMTLIKNAITKGSMPKSGHEVTGPKKSHNVDPRVVAMP